LLLKLQRAISGGVLTHVPTNCLINTEIPTDKLLLLLRLLLMLRLRLRLLLIAGTAGENNTTAPCVGHFVIWRRLIPAAIRARHPDRCLLVNPTTIRLLLMLLKLHHRVFRLPVTITTVSITISCHGSKPRRRLAI